MGEEDVKQEIKPEEKPAEKPAEQNDVEKLAIKIGWNPDYEGSEREFVSAEDYILRSKEIHCEVIVDRDIDESGAVRIVQSIIIIILEIFVQLECIQ